MADAEEDRLEISAESLVVELAKTSLVQLGVFEPGAEAMNAFNTAAARATSRASAVEPTRRDRGAKGG
eukprot:4019897-Pyramimonas_sp.AAC.1